MLETILDATGVPILIDREDPFNAWFEVNADAIHDVLGAERSEFEDRYVRKHGVLPPGSKPRVGLKVAPSEAGLVG